jgi:hypothetical protein
VSLGDAVPFAIGGQGLSSLLLGPPPQLLSSMLPIGSLRSALDFAFTELSSAPSVETYEVPLSSDWSFGLTPHGHSGPGEM